jgi:hypothetical protein
MLTRREVAAQFHTSAETIYRLNRNLKTRGEIDVERTDDRQRSQIRLIRVVKTLAPELAVTTRADDTAEPVQTPQTAIEAPQAISITHVVVSPTLPAPEPTPTAAPPDALAPPASELPEGWRLNWNQAWYWCYTAERVMTPTYRTRDEAIAAAWRMVQSEATPVGDVADDAGIDWADIERRVAAMSPDEVMRVVDLEREAAAYTWTGHEYRVWVESHAPAPEEAAHADTHQQAKNQRSEASERARWEAMRDAGDRKGLQEQLGKLRNRVRRQPAAHVWADRKIRVLGDILAAMSEAPTSAAGDNNNVRSSQTTPAIQQTLFATGGIP